MITILNASPKMMTKQFKIMNDVLVKIAYDKPYTFKYEFADCKNLTDLYDVIQYLAQEPSKCIIRAQLRPGLTITEGTRRKRTVDDPFIENPDGVDFAMCDFDEIAIPSNLPFDLDYYMEYLISLLPDYMHNVSYVYQWSSSAGMDGWKTLRCHIWFWLAEPRTDTEMKHWAKQINDPVKIIDDSVFRTVQPNYTADPIFHLHVKDPVPGARVGLIKKDVDAAPVPVVAGPKPTYVKTSTGRYIDLTPPMGLKNKFDVRLEAIGPDYHLPITQAIGSWIALTGAGSDFNRLKQRLRSRISTAPGSGSAGQDHYLSDAYLDAQIQSCPFQHKVGGPVRMPETQAERLRYVLANGKGI